MTTRAKFEERTLDQLVIDDEQSFRHVALYIDLKRVLLRSGYKFRVFPSTGAARWDRALFLNLTFWGSGEGDVLVDEHLPADVVAHVAWHHLAAKPEPGAPNAPLSSDALFLGESIASAFDLYLVGRLLGHAPDSSFLETQVGAMSECAEAAGTTEDEFGELLESVAADPERAFEDLRELLFDATTSLVDCKSLDDANDVLAGLDGHRFASLLHHYELSNWILYARAYANTSDAVRPDPRARRIDRALRDADVALDWLSKEWLTPT